MSAPRARSKRPAVHHDQHRPCIKDIAMCVHTTGTLCTTGAQAKARWVVQAALHVASWRCLLRQARAPLCGTSTVLPPPSLRQARPVGVIFNRPRLCTPSTHTVSAYARAPTSCHPTRSASWPAAHRSAPVAQCNAPKLHGCPALNSHRSRVHQAQSGLVLQKLQLYSYL